MLVAGLPSLGEDQDLDYHYLYEGLGTTLICWVLLALFFYCTLYIYDLADEEDFTHYLNYNSFEGSTPLFVFQEDWDIIYDDSAEDDLVDTYEDDDLYNICVDSAEIDGDEIDHNIDAFLNVNFFESVYNSAEIADKIHWANSLGTLYAFRST
jgi:hypothetical protein